MQVTLNGYGDEDPLVVRDDKRLTGGSYEEDILVIGRMGQHEIEVTYDELEAILRAIKLVAPDWAFE